MALIFTFRGVRGTFFRRVWRFSENAEHFQDLRSMPGPRGNCNGIIDVVYMQCSKTIKSLMKIVFYLKNPCSGSVRAKMISITIIHHSVISLKSIYLSSQKSNQGSKKRKTIRISLRIHPAPFPTAGLTIDALKRGKRVVVVIAETRKSVLEHNRSKWYENIYKILNQANICPAPHNVLPAPYGSEIIYRFIPAFNQNFQMPQVDHNVLMMQSIPGTVQVLSCLARRRKRPRPSLKST